MSSERNIAQKLKGTILSVPSMLANNRTIIAVLAFLYLLPLVTTAGHSPIRTLLYLITQIMIFALLAMSFDLQLGRSALLNFGHVALFGVGAYVMAFSLDASILPPPFNFIAAIPYPFTLILAMMVGGFLGLIMGLTTSRLRGTAFAFIALAIAMFIFNFFTENPDISGGETGLIVATPDLIRTGPSYLFFVGLAFVLLAAFVGMVILYIRKRQDRVGLILITPVMMALTGVVLIFSPNVLGPLLVIAAFLVLIVLYLMDQDGTLSDPLQFSKYETAGEERPTILLTNYILPFIIIAFVIFGFIVSFSTNITEMVSLWIEDRFLYFFTIPVTYYLVLTCLVITYVFVRRLIASPFGRMVIAVAQNEERAEALGYNSYRAKIVVLVISGAIAGLAGGLYAQFLPVIDPHTVLGVEITINAMLYTIIGGIGTLLGPILGTGVVVYSEHNMVDFITDGLGLPGQLWLVGLGVMYIFIVLFMPLGIVGSVGRRVDSFKIKLRQLKVRQFEFGLRDSDYWVFGLLGTMGLILFISEEARLLLIALGIFGFLGVVGFFFMIIFRREIWAGVKAFGGRSKSNLKAFFRRIRLRLKRGK